MSRSPPVLLALALSGAAESAEEEARDLVDLRTIPRYPRVLHLVTRYLRGGSEQRIRDIVRSLPEGEHHIVMGIESDVDLVRREVAPASCNVLNTLVRDPSPIRDAAALTSIVRLLRRRPFDVLITHQSKAGVLGRVAASLTRGPPTVHSLSMANFGPGFSVGQDRLFRAIEARLHRATAAYAVVGRDLAARYAAIGVPDHKLVVVRSSVRLPDGTRDEATRRDACERFGLPSRRPIVLYLGSLEPRKNVLDLVPLLEGLIHIEPRDARPFLVIAGEGPLSSALAAALHSHGLSCDAAMLGYVDRPDRLIVAADAMVLLSEAEGVPQVLVQASAVGTPFVAYDVDGVKELLALGANGLAVPLGNVDDAAKATALKLSESGGPTRSIDLSSWEPGRIEQEHRRLIAGVLASGLVAAPRRDALR